MAALSALFMGSIRLAQRVAQRLPASWYAQVRTRWHRLRQTLPPHLASRAFEGIPGRVHVVDYMHRDVRHVAAAGQDAVRNLDAALAAAGRSWGDIRRCLDYGCGYGRVLRWLTGRGFEIVSADVNAHGVAFCAAEFGTTPFVIPRGREDWALPGSFDLIWVGSVLTHLAADTCEALVVRLAHALNPRGLLVFTTHGELQGDGAQYGRDVHERAAAIQAALAAGEVVFVPTREDPAWGQTFHPRPAVRAALQRLGLRLLHEAPRGWDAHQDVWTVTRG